jgi:hypothetical protein
MSLAKELRKRRQVDARKIEVSAWADSEGNPFVFYCFPITCNDLKVLEAKHPKFLENTTVAAMVDLIVLKASSESGEKLFTSAEDRVELMGEEISVISDIANKMFAEIQTLEEIEKN